MSAEYPTKYSAAYGAELVAQSVDVALGTSRFKSGISFCTSAHASHEAIERAFVKSVKRPAEYFVGYSALIVYRALCASHSYA